MRERLVQLCALNHGEAASRVFRPEPDHGVLRIPEERLPPEDPKEKFGQMVFKKNLGQKIFPGGLKFESQTWKG